MGLFSFLTKVMDEMKLLDVAVCPDGQTAGWMGYVSHDVTVAFT
jgi:hypothetical protein